MARTPDETPESNTTSSGKGRATPSRAAQEAARRRPLVANTKEAKAARKEELLKERNRAREGMANGEERYLPVRDRGPQKRWVRDQVDSKWHMAEFLMPFMLIVIIVSLFPTPEVTYYSFVALWIYVLIAIVDMVWLSSRTKRQAAEKFGADRMERGLGWYAAMRSMQMRFMRLPKPQVARGQRDV